MEFLSVAEEEEEDPEVRGISSYVVRSILCCLPSRDVSVVSFRLPLSQDMELPDGSMKIVQTTITSHYLLKMEARQRSSE